MISQATISDPVDSCVRPIGLTGGGLSKGPATSSSSGHDFSPVVGISVKHHGRGCTAAPVRPARSRSAGRGVPPAGRRGRICPRIRPSSRRPTAGHGLPRRLARPGKEGWGAGRGARVAVRRRARPARAAAAAWSVQSGLGQQDSPAPGPVGPRTANTPAGGVPRPARAVRPDRAPAVGAAGASRASTASRAGPGVGGPAHRGTGGVRSEPTRTGTMGSPG